MHLSPGTGHVASLMSTKPQSAQTRPKHVPPTERDSERERERDGGREREREWERKEIEPQRARARAQTREREREEGRVKREKAQTREREREDGRGGARESDLALKRESSIVVSLRVVIRQLCHNLMLMSPHETVAYSLACLLFCIFQKGNPGQEQLAVTHRELHLLQITVAELHQRLSIDVLRHHHV